ncbi:mannan polymerase II complex MNN10 subunit [Geosmithia morbida]|uniref:Mannan polymerase II complex MNN10 subunit n=1 Tax=Geosmithia morbida TaxID=1094350 RepID=A0A9P4YXA2_9HYPO|nr:mannan polymerase II complex MNN10 subunit [Geosmithia morbida]KAF4123502.1 mannan polymerase II complex MNN10 subunit [Geosmithia morbida]
MSLSRSPSPIPGGGWSSPGLNMNSGRSSPAHIPPSAGSNAGASGPWGSASRMRSNHNLNGYPSFSTQNSGFFVRNMRRITSSLPRFYPSDNSNNAYGYKDKAARGGGWAPRNASFGERISSIFGRMGRKRSSWGGGGEKFVIILGANLGGGVMEWKGAREWAVERDSVRNKRKYSNRWGYNLEIVDMSIKKRYAHEWRESWEKVDFMRSAMRKYPDAEWFWWLDLNTYIMELSYPLQEHIFTDLEDKVYRDINEWNPLNITHPPTEPYLDAEALSAVGDGKANSLNLLLSQDCAGFNLGSFMMRRSAWTERLLDMWWDPVMYEQKHMDWDHKEQDALEEMYESHPWVRQHTGFLPQRTINSFPPGACVELDDAGVQQNNSRFHYNEDDHDFLVNMAGCEWGRDCWGEMYHYREFGYWLNRNPWERFKEDFVAVIWHKLTGQWVKL